MENNFNLTGDEARVLMAALLTATASVPAKDAINLYIKLAAINHAQPA